jgi:sigma-E factor negative regulatory protein RseA
MIMDNLTMSMVKTMKTKNEHLSAVFDDEAGAFEQRRLLDELEKDGDLQQSWSNMP